MSAYFPVSLNIRGRRCLVVGGGAIALGKVTGLLDAGADVLVVAPELGEALQALVDDATIQWTPRAFAPNDLDGVMLVMVANEGRSENQAVWEAAQERGVLINAVDDPEHCTFILPANHRRGDLVISVSSGGKSPALASNVRDRIAESIGDEYADLLTMLGDLRSEVTSRIPDLGVRTRVWRRFIASDALASIASGDTEGARQTLRSILEDAVHNEVRA